MGVLFLLSAVQAFSQKDITVENPLTIAEIEGRTDSGVLTAQEAVAREMEFTDGTVSAIANGASSAFVDGDIKGVELNVSLSFLDSIQKPNGEELVFYNGLSGKTQMRFTEQGYWGVGMDIVSPESPLHVLGDFRVQSDWVDIDPVDEVKDVFSKLSADAFIIGPNSLEGECSAVYGLDNLCEGKYSTAYGNSLYSLADYGVVMGGEGNLLDNSLSTFLAAGSFAEVSGMIRGVMISPSVTAGQGDNYGVLVGQSSAMLGADHSVIFGGKDNLAKASYSVVAGHSAEALHNHCFVWSSGPVVNPDAEPGDPTVIGMRTTGSRQFVIHAEGGIRLVTGNDPIMLIDGSSVPIADSIIPCQGDIAMAGAAFTAPATIQRDPVVPTWWYKKGVICTDGTDEVNDYGAANQGQLVLMLAMLKEHFDEYLNVAGQTPLCDAVTMDALLPRNSEDDPFDMTSTAGANFAINAGQLKHAVAPFYDLIWELRKTNPGIEKSLLSCHSGKYPWSVPVALEDDPATVEIDESLTEGLGDEVNNYSMINVGQLKNAFAIDLDVNNNDLPDWKELEAGVYSYDRPTDLTADVLYTSVSISKSDTGNDVADALEVALNLNSTSSDTPVGDQNDNDIDDIEEVAEGQTFDPTLFFIHTQLPEGAVR